MYRLVLTFVLQEFLKSSDLFLSPNAQFSLSVYTSWKKTVVEQVGADGGWKTSTAPTKETLI